MTIRKFIVLFLLFSLTIFAQLPEDKNLLLWIGEDDGAKAIDATANKNHGSLHDGVKWVGGGRAGSKAIDLMKNGSFFRDPRFLES